MLDLFAVEPPQQYFYWVVALFTGHGAMNVIQKAREIPLQTYYPIRFTGRGEPVPLWRPYLFIEFHESLTIEVCRTTKNFLKILSMRDKEGNTYPILVRQHAIDFHINLMLKGKFNDKMYKRRFYGKGTVTRVLEGTFIDKRVRLLMDVEPSWPGTRKVPVDINGMRGMIELWKLAL